MKRIQRNLVVLMVGVGVLLAMPVLMAAIPKTKADHLSVAEKYENLAVEQEAIAKEHTQMKQDYRADQASLPKQIREKSLADMDQHCDALIQAAKKEANAYRAIAQWHKIRATEVEK